MESARSKHTHCEAGDEKDFQRKLGGIDYFSCQDTPQISNGADQGHYSKLE